jgi:hypothetical protein
VGKNQEDRNNICEKIIETIARNIKENTKKTKRIKRGRKE